MRTGLAIAALLAMLASAAPAMASQQLTRKEASNASRLMAKETIGSLLYGSVGTAPVKVSRCRVRAARGQCRVIVNGTSHVTYISHVVKLHGDFMVWGTDLTVL